MAKLNILNSETISKGIRDLGLIALGGLLIMKAPAGCRSFVESSKYKSNMNSVVNYANEGNFEASRELLEKFKENNILNPADVSKLEVRINLAEKEFAMKKEEDLLKAEEEKKDPGLNNEISNELDSASVDRSANGSDLIPSKYGLNFRDMELQYAEINIPLEDILANVEYAFINNFDLENIITHLELFQNELNDADESEIRNLDIKKFSNVSALYLSANMLEYKRNLESDFGNDPKPFATPVVIVRKRGKVENGVAKYHWSETPSDIPLYTIGFYSRDSRNTDDYHLISIGGIGYWFDKHEIAEIPDIEGFKSLRIIGDKVTDILDYCNSIKENSMEENSDGEN